MPKKFLLITTFFWIITAISPLYRHDWMMENILFVIFFSALVFTYKKFQFSNTSYFLITTFFILHLVGAHYTYAEVPLGFWISNLFNFSRNHFDRIVHFAFGLLLAYPIREFLIKKISIKGFFSYYLPIGVVLSWSGFFEILEWLFTLQVSEELRQAYLGMQNDIWDAQKDMLLALVGALIAMTICFISDKKNLKT